MARISSEQFKVLVQERAASDYRYPEAKILPLATTEGEADIRYAGAYITKALLADQTGKLVLVLYSDKDISKAKLNASHGMTPRDELSGQHGPGRWADWEDITPGYLQRSHRERFAMLRATLPADEVRLERSFELIKHGLEIRSSAANDGDTPRDYRLGEHLYFPLPGGDLDDVEVLSHDVPLENPDIQRKIRENGWFWDGFDGDMTVQLPDRRVHIRSACTLMFNESDFGEHPLGMMFWQREGTESICIEPLWGYTEGVTDVDGGGIKLGAGSVATLKTTILLLS